MVDLPSAAQGQNTVFDAVVSAELISLMLRNIKLILFRAVDVANCVVHDGKVGGDSDRKYVR